MHKLKFGVWLLLLGFCFSVSVRAQDKPPLFDGVERVFREKEPQWKIETLNVKGEIDPLEQNIVFKAGKQQASVRLVVWKEVKNARDTFAAGAIVKSNMSKGMKRQRLHNFGDEGYMWIHPGSNAWPIIDFRKGASNVTVFAPTVAIARRFARHILGQIDANQN
jgi:hypothetical protein